MPARNRNKLPTIMKTITWVCLLAAVATGGAAEVKPGYGISSWAGWKPGQISQAECPELRSVPLILVLATPEFYDWLFAQQRN